MQYLYRIVDCYEFTHCQNLKVLNCGKTVRTKYIVE